VAVPVRDPLYDDLRSLTVRRQIRVPGLFARPASSYRLAAALARRSRAGPTPGDATPGDPALDRARAALADPLRQTGLDPAAPRSPVLMEFGDEASRLQISAFARFQSEAAPDRGFVLTDSTRAGFHFSWIVWPGFHLFEELYVADVPDGHEFADPLIADTDIIIFQDRVYMGLHTRYADLTLGREHLAWGPGVIGGLLISPGSAPFTQLRLERGFLDGRIYAVVVNGVLSQAEERYVAFHRLDWQVTERLRFAFSEGARYNADWIEPLYLVGIIPYTVVGRLLERDNEIRENDDLVRNNVMWSIDASYFLRDGAEIYGELLIDDLGTDTSQTPTRIGYQLGALIASRLGGRPLTIRGEWTRVWRYVYSVFYQADYIHDGLPLGYPQGPDSRHIHLDAAIEVRRGLEIGAIGERIDQGEDGLGVFWDPDDPAQAGADAGDFAGTVERQWRLLGSCRYRPSSSIEAAIEFGGSWVRNSAHTDEDRAGMTGRVVLAISR
jgi:hypothetical protein